jgi:hypothetical protein
MIYYTQLIFIKTGCEKEFHAFEDNVLPLLQNHNAELVYRIRPAENAFVAANAELPYEIHIVTFVSKEDFKGYAADPKRLQFMEMKNNSVDKIILIEGVAL